MRVIPVLDIRHGQAVHAVAGRRAHYGPLRSVLHEGTDPIALARAGLETWALTDLYVADLDAILGEDSPAFNLFRAIRDLGLTPWVDAGVREPGDVSALIEAGVERVLVGLETIAGPAALAEIVDEVGADRVVFSLDLIDGRPLIETSAIWESRLGAEIAEQAIGLGIRRLVHLDLAHVGTGRSAGARSLGWLAELARSIPGVDWLIGGGIDSVADLAGFARMGAWGALVGSALHDGRMTAEHLEGLDRR